MEGRLGLQLMLQAALIALNAIFACAEIAVISMNDAKLASLAAAGDKRAVRLARLTSQPARFLATIQVAITLSGFLGSAFAADSFSDVIVDWLIGMGVGISPAALNTIAVVFITIILSFFTLVFGELVPKRVAMKRAERLALGMSALVSFISKLFAPVVWLLTASTNGVLRVFGIDPNAKDEEVTEEEIRMMVDVGSQRGVIDPAEKVYIDNIFRFDDRDAGEIATHRTEVTLLWREESAEQWERTIHEARFTYYPVCGETADDVIGVLDAKDYFRLNSHDMETILGEAVHPAYFVPESVKADILLRNMKRDRQTFAVVLDEYGGMSGIITIFDLVEQLVGDLGGEEEDYPDLEPADSGTWRAAGRAPLDEVAERLNVTLPCDEYDTLGGFILGVLGEIPPDGSTPELDAFGLHIKVLEICEHRVERALLCASGEDSPINN